MSRSKLTFKGSVIISVDLITLISDDDMNFKRGKYLHIILMEIDRLKLLRNLKINLKRKCYIAQV